MNEKMEIIDGQGRKEACKELGLPIYYIIRNGIGLKECQVINRPGETWGLINFIKSSAELGIYDYERLMYYAEKSKPLTIKEVAMCLSRFMSHMVIPRLRKGDYQIVEGDLELGCLEFLKQAKVYFAGVRGGFEHFAPVLIGLYKGSGQPLIDEQRMLDTLNANGHLIKPAYSNEDALSNLQIIYNHGRHKQVFFRDAYLAMAAARSIKGLSKKNKAPAEATA